MIWEVKMPRLDEDMKEGTVTCWLKGEGEFVQKGEPIVEIETQKVNYEIEAPGSGVLRIILAGEGDLLPINSVLAVIAEPGADVSAYRKPIAEAKEKDAPSHKEKARILISPIAKKLAKERNLDISRIPGTGPGGRITKKDIFNFQSAEAKPAFAEAIPGVLQTLPLSGMRKTIADRMSESWHKSPRTELFMNADLTDFVRIRQQFGSDWERRYGINPSVNDAIVLSAARTLRAFPVLNSSLKDGRIEIYDDINISIAVALDRGLITPVLRHADRRNIFEIAREARRLAELVRNSKHTFETLSGSTFTVTNLGMFDVEFFVPVINPPESAILSVGKMDKKPVVVEDAIVIRSMAGFCLAFDHRVLDGVVAAQFLRALKEGLENPEGLFETET